MVPLVSLLVLHGFSVLSLVRARIQSLKCDLGPALRWLCRDDKILLLSLVLSLTLPPIILSSALLHPRAGRCQKLAPVWEKSSIQIGEKHPSDNLIVLGKVKFRADGVGISVKSLDSGVIGIGWARGWGLRVVGKKVRDMGGIRAC